jgi:zinc transporter ZupT
MTRTAETTTAIETAPPSPPAAPDGNDRSPVWLAVLLPLVALAVLLAVVLTVDPLGSLTTAPPSEALAVERVTFGPGHVQLRVRNDGPEPVTLAQVLVNDAYWNHTIGDTSLDRFQATTVGIEYPWEEGLPLRVTLVSSTGLTFEHDVAVATLTPTFDGTVLWRYGLVGLLVGVLPIAVGLLWLPALRRASETVVRTVLAFTVGLLVVLLVETVDEGLELAGEAPGSLGGTQVFVAAAVGILAVMAAVDHVIRRRSSAATTGLVTAYLVAIGIGLHNAGEGIAIGAAVTAGELALGSALLVGFAAHNVTEGVAIAGPMASDRGRLRFGHLVALVLIAGGPAILGAWAGALAFSALWAAAMFGVAAGAIAQVIMAIGRSIVRNITPAIAAGFVAGLVVMYVTGLLAA